LLGKSLPKVKYFQGTKRKRAMPTLLMSAGVSREVRLCATISGSGAEVQTHA